jgi:hypothetical protein
MQCIALRVDGFSIELHKLRLFAECKYQIRLRLALRLEPGCSPNSGPLGPLSAMLALSFQTIEARYACQQNHEFCF